jgi:exosome complex component RRP4
VAGLVERVNKLVTVRPLHARYGGDVGDIVVGRVREVGSKRWRVDVGGRQDGTLMLSAVHLEGGEQRRRTFEDQLNMRALLAEGDLVSAEVYSVQADGGLQLHARSAKYGRLANGVLVRVPPSLVRRLKQHVVTLPCGVDAILGLNGFIWLTESFSATAAAGAGGGDGDGSAGAGTSAAPSAGDVAAGDDAAAAEAGLVDAIERRKELAASRVIGREGRTAVAAVHNAIAALAARSLAVSPESIMDVVHDATAAGLPPAAMLTTDGLPVVTRTAWAKAARRG